jgi:hypothetical protein
MRGSSKTVLADVTDPVHAGGLWFESAAAHQTRASLTYSVGSADSVRRL